jgi:peptidoglycan/xylan/chitin deacetylase (PgdA/CDA1 family)
MSTSTPEPIPMLLYHSISDTPSRWISPLTVSPAAFARHLDLIADSGRAVVTVSELLRGLDGRRPMPRRPIVITFDDGFADNLTVAAPLLAARDMVATVYLTTGALGGASPGGDRMLGWPQVAELAAAGHEVGAHTHRHPELDLVSAAFARQEITRCKHAIEDRLGAPVESFAYPFGYSSPMVRDLVAEAGYGSACSVKNALTSTAPPRFQIPRLAVGARMPDRHLQRWLAGKGAPVGRSGERTVSRGWRAWRLARSVGRAPRVWPQATSDSADISTGPVTKDWY